MRTITKVTCMATALVIACTVYVRAETLVYKGSDGSTGETVITANSDGYLVTSKVGNWDHEVTTDDSLSTLRWAYHKPNDGTDVVFTRSGNTLTGDGVYKGKKFQKIYQVDAEPWYEEWGVGLRSFVMGAEKKSVFWSINPNNLNQIGKFEATRLERQTFVINKTAVEAIHVKISLQGILSLFYSTDYLFRASDGTVVRMKNPSSDGKSEVEMDLSEVNPNP
jgi:hypothetical protein